jgi:hypothetical protein
VATGTFRGRWAAIRLILLVAAYTSPGIATAGVVMLSSTEPVSAQICSNGQAHFNPWGWDLYQELQWVGNSSGCFAPDVGAGNWYFFQRAAPSIAYMYSSDRDWWCGALAYSSEPETYGGYSNNATGYYISYGTCGLQADMNSYWQQSSLDFWNYQHQG